MTLQTQEGPKKKVAIAPESLEWNVWKLHIVVLNKTWFLSNAGDLLVALAMPRCPIRHVALGRRGEVLAERLAPGSAELPCWWGEQQEFTVVTILPSGREQFQGRWNARSGQNWPGKVGWGSLGPGEGLGQPPNLIPASGLQSPT